MYLISFLKKQQLNLEERTRKWEGYAGEIATFSFM
jgi:hypothetical protein